jgi:hypothetical protein
LQHRAPAAEVQRFFPVKKGSPVQAFGSIAASYPVFELEPIDRPASGLNRPRTAFVQSVRSGILLVSILLSGRRQSAAISAVTRADILK